jgi:hydrogenase maturation protease
MKKKNLIIGLGNDILMDDGIGPKLSIWLKEKLGTEDIDYSTAATGGLDIIEYILGYEKVIFIDAIKTRDGIPGSIYHYLPENFRETAHLSSLHDVSFLTALKLGKQLHMNLPSIIHIIAIEIIEDMEFSEEFTVPIREKYALIQEGVLKLAQKILKQS